MARHKWSVAVLLTIVACGCQQPQPIPPKPQEGVKPVVTPTTRGTYHIVRRGETLSAIASLYRVAASTIMQANHLRDQNSIYPGLKLFIPGAAPGVPSTPKIPDLSNIQSERYFIWPLRGPVLKQFTPTGSDTEHTRGIVIGARMGQPVVAAMSGVVTFASEAFHGYGKTILIRHAGGLSTFYAYNSRILVNVGDTVVQGQPIAEAGQSGRATSPQLLFRILLNEEPIDPLRYLP